MPVGYTTVPAHKSYTHPCATQVSGKSVVGHGLQSSDESPHLGRGTAAALHSGTNHIAKSHRPPRSSLSNLSHPDRRHHYGAIIALGPRSERGRPTRQRAALQSSRLQPWKPLLQHFVTS